MWLAKWLALPRCSMVSLEMPLALGLLRAPRKDAFSGHAARASGDRGDVAVSRPL